MFTSYFCIELNDSPNFCRRFDAAIPIEERSAAQVTTVRGLSIAPKGIKARHPAFDVTPAELIAGIMTERGVARAPYRESLQALFEAPVTPAKAGDQDWMPASAGMTKK